MVVFFRIFFVLIKVINTFMSMLFATCFKKLRLLKLLIVSMIGHSGGIFILDVLYFEID